MKSIVCYIAIIVCTLSCFQEAAAQTRTRTRPDASNRQNTRTPDLTIRAQSKNEDQTREIGNAPWMREIYRMVNLKDEANTPLYYPVEPIGDRMNLFTIIFKLMSEDKLTAYEFLDGREIFTDQYKVGFKETLDRFQILYNEEKVGASTRYVVNDSDIPSGDVLSYLIKEAWYFDAANSTVDIKLLAICPMLIREGDFGDLSRMPMFWLPYENIRPYILQKPIMTSNVNNATTYTIDDYFRKRMFQGEIIKTSNLLNHTLAQQAGDSPDSLKLIQDSIEKQLKAFETNLWLVKDTTTVTNKKGKKTKEKKVSKPKQSGNSSSAPTHSVRRTR